MLCFWTFYLSNEPGKNVSQFPQKYQAAQLFSKLIIQNISWVPNEHIRMISEGSCDTEDCWKFSFVVTEINYILKYYLNFLYFTILLFLLTAALLSLREFLSKTFQTNLTTLKLLYSLIK